MQNLRKNIEEAVAFIRSKTRVAPEVGLILGSGLGDLAGEVEADAVVSFGDIPHFPPSTVEGHAGEMHIGSLSGKKVLAMKGRIHYYEGYSMQDITFPVRIMKALGVRALVVTNACGGINEDFTAGDLMVITDHINLMGSNPLYGLNDPQLGARFVDCSNAYDKEFVKMAFEIAKKHGISLRKGVYAAVSGPNYETIAEIRYIGKIGGDAVGMSTVPEVIVCCQAGIRVLGISCVTDVIMKSHGVSHEEVLEVALKTKPRFMTLVKECIREMVP